MAVLPDLDALALEAACMFEKANPLSAAFRPVPAGRRAEDGVIAGHYPLNETPAVEYEVLGEVFAGCDRLARDVVGSYLAAPVDPRIMGRS